MKVTVTYASYSYISTDSRQTRPNHASPRLSEPGSRTKKTLPAKLAAFKATHPEMQPVARLSRAWFGPSSTLAALLVSGLRFGNHLCDAARRLWRLYYYDIRTWLSGTWQRHRRAVEEP